MVAFDLKLLVDNWKYNNSEFAFFFLEKLLKWFKKNVVKGDIFQMELWVKHF